MKFNGNLRETIFLVCLAIWSIEASKLKINLSRNAKELHKQHEELQDFDDHFNVFLSLRKVIYNYRDVEYYGQIGRLFLSVEACFRPAY